MSDAVRNTYSIFALFGTGSVIVIFNAYWREILIGVLLLVCICLFLSKKNVQNKTSQKISDRFIRELHSNFIHKVRTKIINLNKTAEKVSKLDITSSDYKQAFSELQTDAKNDLKDTIEPFLDLISKHLSKIRNDKISVCIKIFSFESNDVEPKDRRVFTVARCSNTAPKRKDRDKTIDNKGVVTVTENLVGENSDFLQLVNGGSHFASSNLNELDAYRNDSKNFEKPRHYISTLVMPIRCALESTNEDGQMIINPNVIGFLCADSKKSILEWEDSESLDWQILAIFADTLYVYLRNFHEIFKNQ